MSSTCWPVRMNYSGFVIPRDNSPAVGVICILRATTSSEQKSARSLSPLSNICSNGCRSVVTPMRCSNAGAGLQHRAQTEQAAEPVPASKSLPQVAPKPTKARVGQRNPGRDPIGETSAPSARAAIRCTFTEVIAVTPSQMEEVEVSRFECPTCLAVREIHPKGETMKFPWHQKRVTNTPNHGVRWVKRESGWSLSE